MSELNPNIKRMRTALSAYHKKALETEKKIDQMKEELLPEVAQERILAAQIELNREKINALDQIVSAAKEGKISAADWGHLRASDIDQADSALLKSGIRLSQNEFDDLCKKHHNNGTMCRILSDYADQHNKTAQGKMEKMLFTSQLETAEKRSLVWDRLEHSAEGLINSIAAGKGFMTGADNSVIIDSVEHFGLNTEVE